MRLITNLLKHLLLLIIGMALLSALALLLGVKLLLDEQPALTQFDKASLEDIRRIKNIAIAVNRELNESMQDYGYDIIKTLVTDIDPDEQVKHAMNRINSALPNISD